MMMMDEELIWQFLSAFISGSFIAIISISTAVTGCGKKKEKAAESACTKPSALQRPSGSIGGGAPAPAAAAVAPESKAPSVQKNSAEKKPEEKKPDEAPAKEEKKDKTDEKKEDEKKPDEAPPKEEPDKTNLKTDTKASAINNKADTAHTKETTTKDASKNEPTGKKEETDDQYQQVDFGPGDLPPPPPK